MSEIKRRRGDRVAVTIKGRVGSRTARSGQPIIGGFGWTLAVDPTDEVLRFRRGNDTIDCTAEEVLTAFARSTITEYDDDYGLPLVQTTGIHPDGTVHELAPDGSMFYGNDRFTVHAFALEEDRGLEGAVRLSVHDHHRNPTIPWRLLQRIKNEVCGPERWAIEWFPPESLLIDEANERHLFVLADGDGPPQGFAFTHGRAVASDAEAAKVGAIQAPLPEWYPEAGGAS